MIVREFSSNIKNWLFRGKILIVFGPRQVGKTTFIEQLLGELDKKIVRFNGDEADIREFLSDTTSAKLKRLVGSANIVFIDEAQRIQNIGLTLKLFADQIKDVQVIASGSSSFELANRANEPLTGRK
ncbi:MAG TPA: AAA family ATPase, partial [Williamwhitmania sp.]|nr:AAA family ATPase [Williamwhitmania sp.]